MQTTAGTWGSRIEATASPELLFATQYRGPVIALSDGWSEVIGIEMNDLVQTPWPELVHPGDVTMLGRWRDDVMWGHSTVPARARIRTRDGGYRFFELAAIAALEGELIVGSAHALAANLEDADGILEVGELALDTRGRTVTAAGRPLGLTVSEFELLKLLISQRGTVLRTDDIARTIWGYQSAGSANFLQAHVSRLRRKLKQGAVGTRS